MIWAFVLVAFFIAFAAYVVLREESSDTVGLSAEPLARRRQRFPSDEEMVQHFGQPADLHIKWRGVFRRLAPDERDTNRTGHLSQAVNQPRADAAHERDGPADDSRMHRKKLEDEVVTVRAPTLCEPEDAGVGKPFSANNQKQRNLHPWLASND